MPITEFMSWPGQFQHPEDLIVHLNGGDAGVVVDGLDIHHAVIIVVNVVKAVVFQQIGVEGVHLTGELLLAVAVGDDLRDSVESIVDTVITNGIDLALALKDIPGITVILTGGIVTSASSSIEGLLGVDLLQKIHTDIAFVSARGFSVENGLTDFSIYEADLKRMCIKASAKTIALIDHTKFDTSSISSYASIDDLNLVITDSGLSENTKEIYEKAGVDLLIAD